MKRKSITPFVAFLAALVLAGCSSSKSGTSNAGAPPASASAVATASPLPPYHVKIDPANYTDVITNPYMPMKPGTTAVYQGTKGNVPLRATFKITNQTKTILGVRCVVVQDTVTLNGSLEEKTLDWFAQDTSGNVWYFGEDSKDYKNGVVVSTTGTWMSGVNGGKPGIVMQASPKPGKPYIEEYLPGVAEDMAKVVKTNATSNVPAGNYKNVLVTLNTNPLDPSLTEHKYYAPGVGLVYENKFVSGVQEIMKLVKSA
jgi:hypothetical protein